jgi:hypothetical protein
LHFIRVPAKPSDSAEVVALLVAIIHENFAAVVEVELKDRRLEGKSHLLIDTRSRRREKPQIHRIGVIWREWENNWIFVTVILSF